MSLPTVIERLNAHLIGFVRAYTFQLARRIEPQLPTGSEGGADPLGHQAALQAARAIVNTARDKLDVRRMLTALENHLAGMGRDDSEPFGRLLAELGDPRYSTTSQSAAAAPEPASAPVATPVAEPAPAPVAAAEPAVAPPPAAAIAEVEPQVKPAAVLVEPEPAAPAAAVEVVEPEAPEVHDAPAPVAAAAAGGTSESPAAEPTDSPVEVAPHEDAASQPADDENREAVK